MTEDKYTVRDKKGQVVQVSLRRDRRLRRTTRWERLPDGSLLVRVPYRLPRRSLGPLLEQITEQLEKANQKHKQRSDADLSQRAALINQRRFKGNIQWNAIRWVNNMQTRIGSCSRGGPTDGEIRISNKIKEWPDWVVDYVIAHELMHRKHPNHSAAFWSELRQAYPLTERARGFIQGMGFSAGHPMDEENEE